MNPIVVILFGGIAIFLLSAAFLTTLADCHNNRYKINITWEPFAISFGLMILYDMYYITLLRG
jgi:hypothetical protein